MTDAILFLGPAIAMCLVIASIHVWLGMHVLAREIIFVDLSLAQLAALGATVAAVASELDEPGWVAHAGAFAFTVAGATLFAFTRHVRRHVSQEAIVGITYAVASAAMVLVLSRSPHGAEHIKDILVGSLLVVDWPQVGLTAGAYAVCGALQVLLRRRFVRISWSPDEAEKEMRHVELWDLAFYLLFGIVITISVQAAGILLVFSYLIVPAVVTQFFLHGLVQRLVAGWGVALVASVAGIAASWVWDLPTGAAIVVAFGLVLAVAAAVRPWHSMG